MDFLYLQIFNWKPCLYWVNLEQLTMYEITKSRTKLCSFPVKERRTGWTNYGTRCLADYGFQKLKAHNIMWDLHPISMCTTAVILHTKQWFGYAIGISGLYRMKHLTLREWSDTYMDLVFAARWAPWSGPALIIQTSLDDLRKWNFGNFCTWFCKKVIPQVTTTDSTSLKHTYHIDTFNANQKIPEQRSVCQWPISFHWP